VTSSSIEVLFPAPLRAPFVTPRERIDGAESNRLLAGLPAADLSVLSADLREVALERGTVLHDIGQPISDVYFPRDGLVGLVCPMVDGQAIETASIGRDGAIGVMAALGPRIACSRAIVHLPGRAVQISTARLTDIADRSEAVHSMIVHAVDSLLGQVQQLSACNTVHPVQARLSRWLLQACHATAADTIPVTQEFIADVLGVQRTTVTMICRLLQSERIIHVRRGRIRILNAAALQAKTCACYAAMRRMADDGIAQRDVASPSYAG
jgi:CRP-like cAMP-binding protein